MSRLSAIKKISGLLKGVTAQAPGKVSAAAKSAAQEAVRPGRIRSVARRAGQEFGRHPISSGLLAAGGGVFLAEEVGGPLIRPLTGDRGREGIKEGFETLETAAYRTARMRRLQRLMMENESILAHAHPHFYNEVLAGRKLPRGAVFLGKTNRRDLMEELVAGMSQGAFASREEGDQDLIDLLRSQQ